MSAVLKASGRSLEGHLYEVFLDRESFQSGALEVPLLEDGISIDYDANEIAVDANILSSTCTVKILVKTEFIRSQVLSLISGREDQSALYVHKNGELEWIGLILADQIEENDETFPQEYVITATDCLARLKTDDYVQPDADEMVTVATHLSRLMQQIPTSRFFSDGEEFYRVHSTMHPQQTDPVDTEFNMDKIRVSYRAFRTVDQQGAVTPSKAYEVLLQILKAFQLRLMMARGRFVFFETPSIRRSTGSIVFHRFQLDGVALTRETLSSWAQWQTVLGDNDEYRISDNPALMRRGGKIGALAPLKSVEYTYKHYSRRNLFPGVTWSRLAVAEPYLDDFSIGDGGGRLQLTGNLNFSLSDNSPTPVYQGAYFIVNMRVAVVDPNSAFTGKGLKRLATITSSGFSYGETTWEDGGFANIYQFVFAAPPPATNPVYTAPFSAITPIVPRSGRLRISFGVPGVTVAGTNYTSAEIDWSIYDVFVESLVDGNISSQFNYRSFNVESSNAEFNSETISRQILIGDGPNPTTFGRFEALDENDEWVLTNGWYRFANGSSQTGDATDHTSLLANDLMALQNDETPKMNSTLMAPLYNSAFSIKRGNDIYLPYRLDFNLLRDECSGEWLKITTTPVTGTGPTTITDAVEIAEDDSPPPPPPNPPGGITGPVGPIQTGVNTIAAVTLIDVPLGLPVSVIPINIDPAELPLQEGDELLITDAYTGEVTTITVAADYVDGVPNPWVDPNGDSWTTPGGDSWIVNTTPGLSVVEFTPVREIRAGSYVQVSPASQSVTNALLRVQYELFTLFGLTTPVTVGQTNSFWRPVDRVGWKIKGFIIAMGQNPSDSTLEFKLNHLDNLGTATTIGTFTASGLDFKVAMDTTVIAGIYLFEPVSVGAGITGLQVAFQLKQVLT